jgi:hypothetical protein
MVNAVEQALRSVYIKIPQEILELAFDQKGKRRSLDEAITEEIIEGRVRPDVSAICGQYKKIVMLPQWARMSRMQTSDANMIPLIPFAIYKIPPEAREYRSITQVLSMSMPYGATNSLAMMASGMMGGMTRGVTAGSFANAAMNGVTFNDAPIMPTPILMAGNQIKITPAEMAMITSFSWILDCRLEYDKDFTNLTPDAVVQLSELIVTAAKAWIYNRLTIKLDMGYIHSGQEVGRVKEIIDTYADAGDRYDVIRKEFHGSAEQLDVNTMRDRLLLAL